VEDVLIAVTISVVVGFIVVVVVVVVVIIIRNNDGTLGPSSLLDHCRRTIVVKVAIRKQAYATRVWPAWLRVRLLASVSLSLLRRC
jgi:hypothetical protein